MIGLSLNKIDISKIKVIEQSLKSIGIECIEIPHYTKYLPQLNEISKMKIFSVHARKNAMNMLDIEFDKYLIDLNKYLKYYNCNNVVFHLSEDYVNNEKKCMKIKSTLSGINIHIENTLPNMFVLMKISKKFDFKITFDISHGIFNNHILIEDTYKRVGYYHIRGYSDKKKYVPLFNTINYYDKNLIKKGTYIFEYDYKNIFEIYRDVSCFKKYFIIGD